MCYTQLVLRDRRVTSSQWIFETEKKNQINYRNQAIENRLCANNPIASQSR